MVEKDEYKNDKDMLWHSVLYVFMWLIMNTICMHHIIASYDS
jgi:hypothetical protein